MARRCPGAKRLSGIQRRTCAAFCAPRQQPSASRRVVSRGWPAAAALNDDLLPCRLPKGALCLLRNVTAALGPSDLNRSGQRTAGDNIIWSAPEGCASSARSAAGCCFSSGSWATAWAALATAVRPSTMVIETAAACSATAAFREGLRRSCRNRHLCAASELPAAEWPPNPA
jgi:hypothetical protein